MPLPQGDAKEDSIFSTLEQAAVDTTPEHSNRPDWIALDTWELIDYRAANCRKLTPDAFQDISQRISRLLKCDRRIRVENAGEQIESELHNNNPQGAFSELKNGTGK